MLGDVQTAYQRHDLIGNLVNTVKVLLNLKSNLTAVIEARAKATQVTIDPTNILQIN
jgi:LemA protein